jgi:hypothetical protein
MMTVAEEAVLQKLLQNCGAGARYADRMKYRNTCTYSRFSPDRQRTNAEKGCNRMTL